MRHPYPFRPSSRCGFTLLCAAFALLLGLPWLTQSRVEAATITWGTPTTIAGDNDVSTSGTSVAAYRTTPAGGSSATVNTVTFQPFPIASGSTSPYTAGSFTISGGSTFFTNSLNSTAGNPFASLSASYKAALDTPAYTGAGFTLRMTNLTPGALYQIQLWVDYSPSVSSTTTVTATAGNAVALNINTANAPGGLGQWVTGTFIADASTQDIGLAGSNTTTYLNAFQIRLMESPSLVVTTTSDAVAADGRTSLREAINYAATLSGPQTITFSNSTANGAVNFSDGTARTITLGGSELVLDGFVAIDGPGADRLAVSGNNASRIFSIPTTGTARVSGLTITGGNGGGAAQNGYGGGLLNRGTLILVRCAVTGNTAATAGGAITAREGAATPTATYVVDSLLSGNSSNSGGAIFGNYSSIYLINSTIANNNGPSGGGVVGNGGMIVAINSTITGNIGAQTGGVGGLYATGFQARNTIIAGNSGQRPDILSNGAAFNSLGYNLIGDTSGSSLNSPATGDLRNVTANLGTLQNNGGPTATVALLTGNPAINAGSPTVSEIQSVTVRGSAGTFTLTVGGQTTSAIAYNATEATVRVALENLSTVGTGNVEVLYGAGTFTFHYRTGTLAETNVPDLTAAGSGGSTVQARTILQGGNLIADQRGKVRPQFSLADMGAYELTAFDTGQTIITVGGASWYIGLPAVGSDLRVYREVVGQTPEWVDSAAGSRISQLGDGSVVVQTASGDVSARLGSASGRGTSWQSLSKVVAGDGATWFLSSETSGSDRLIYRWGTDGTLAYSNAAGVQLAVLSDGSILSRNTAGASYRRLGSSTGLGTTWQLLSESLLVTTTADENNGASDPTLGTGTSLREAIAYAATLGSPQTITFSNSTANGAVNFHDGAARTITLGGSELFVTSYVNIEGPGAGQLAISGNNASRVMFVETTGIVRLTGLTITGGNGAGAINSDRGGGLASRGTLTIVRCVVTGNTCTSSGGGIYSGNPSTIPVTLHVIDSLVSNNTAQSAGVYHNGGACYVINSTIANNAGEGLRGNGGETFTINATIANNNGSSGTTGGVGATSFRFRNTIIAGNTGSRPNISLSTVSHKSLGYNLIGDTSGSTINPPATGDLYNVAAQLGVLQNNGGPTATVALQTGSPAINAGSTVPEIQAFTVRGTAGTFTLTVGGQTTAPLPYNATASDISTALNGLSTVGPGSVDVQANGGTFTLFYQGALANTNVPDLSASGTGGTTVFTQTLLHGGAMAIDQRGKVRPQFSLTDMGAYELSAFDTGQTIITAGGASWYLGLPAVGSDLRVYREVAGQIPEWVDNSAGSRISQLGDGTVVVQTASGDVSARLGSASGRGTSWQSLSKVVAGDGATWFLSSETSGSDRLIYRWGTDGTLAYSNAAGVLLISEPEGSIVARNTAGDAYLRLGSSTGLGTTWQLLSESLVVTTTADEDNGTSSPAIGAGTSLREALAYAARIGGVQTITFSDSAAGGAVNFYDGTSHIITLSGSELVPASDVTIDGPGADKLTLDGNDASRLFQIQSGKTVTLSGLALVRGNAVGAAGGGVLNYGTLTLRRCLLANNRAESGGGLNTYGTATLLQCTVANNQAGIFGGGVNGDTISTPSQTTISQCTIVNNLTNGMGAGLAMTSNSVLAMSQSTVAGNAANNNGGGFYLSSNATANLSNSLVVGNTVSGNASEVVAVSSGQLHDGGGNLTILSPGTTLGQLLVTDGSGNPLLANNGGSTPTVALAPGSAAIDAGLDLDHLSAALDAIGTTLTVSDSARFPAGVSVQIDNEQMIVSSAPTPASLTVSRGANGTTAAAHLAGRPLNLTTDQRGASFARVVQGRQATGVPRPDAGAYEYVPASVAAPTFAAGVSATGITVGSSDGPLDLTGPTVGATPSGGTFTGTGVSVNNGTIFTPSGLTLGDYLITYTTVPTVDGFTGSASFTIHVVDNTPPAVVSVTSATRDGAYRAGQTVTVKVAFTEAVNVTGTPQLELSIGPAAYDSGTGTSTLTFTHLIAAGENSADLDYASTTALTVQGGRIADAADNAALLTISAPGTAGSLGANAALVIDTLAPSVVISPPSAAQSTGGDVSFTITYSDANPLAITLAESHVTLSSTRSAQGQVTVSGTGTTRTVTISGISGYGTLAISIAAGTAMDSAGNAALAAGPSTAVAVRQNQLAHDDFVFTAGTKPTLIDVLANDEPVPNGTATITIQDLPLQGTATVEAGQVRYRASRALPSSGDRFTYEYNDGLGGIATATVTVTDFFSTAAGTYNGLVQAAPSTTPDNAQFGVIRLTLNRTTGKFTGSLKLAGKSFPLKGVFDAAGMAKFGSAGATEQVLKRKGLSDLHLTLQLGLASTITKLTGALTEGSSPFAAIDADRNLYTAKANPELPYQTLPADLPGKYTVAFVAQSPADQGLAADQYPQGHGYGLLIVSKTGSVRLTATLADNSKITATNAIAGDRRWPFYAAFAGGKGSISGFTFFGDNPANDLDAADVLWFKPANAKAKYYPAGWASGIRTDLIGSRLTIPPVNPPASILPGLSVADADGNAVIEFTSGNLAGGGFEKAVNISVKDLASAVTPGLDQLLLTLRGTPTSATKIIGYYEDGGVDYPLIKVTAASQARGSFSGHFFTSSTATKSTNYRGVILQKQQIGLGFFLGTNESGAVSLIPQ